MNIYSVFEEAAASHPTRTALVHGNKSLTYAELENRITALENAFRSKGIVPGDRVLVFVPVGLHLYAAVLALFRMGAVAMFIDEWAGKNRVSSCLDVVPCKAMVCTTLSGLFSFKVKALRYIPKKIRIRYLDGNTAHPVFSADNDTEALITFTTGSTGPPKAANRTHGFLMAQLRALQPYLSKDIERKQLCTLPVVTLLNLAMGKTTVLPNFSLKPARFDAQKMKRTLVQNGVQEIISSPFYISGLCAVGLPESIEMVQTGGGAVFAEDARAWTIAAPKVTFTVFYGSTECEPVSHISAKDILNLSDAERGLPVGDIATETSLRIIPFFESGYRTVTETEFESIQLSGSPGEIVVAGGHVLGSYIGLREMALDNKIRVGNTLWHRTGDAGYMKGSSLYLLGRCAERIQIAKGNIFPFEVEGLLRRIIGKTAGTMLEHNGLRLVLLQEVRPRETEICAFIDEKWHLKPAVFYVETIPMDPRHHTKIDYKQLRKQIDG